MADTTKRTTKVTRRRETNPQPVIVPGAPGLIRVADLAAEIAATVAGVRDAIHKMRQGVAQLATAAKNKEAAAKHRAAARVLLAKVEGESVRAVLDAMLLITGPDAGEALAKLRTGFAARNPKFPGLFDLIRSLRRALLLLRPTKGCKQIRLLTDGGIAGASAHLPELRRLNRSKDVQINVHNYGRRSEHVAVMKEMAEQSGGRYSRISTDE